MPKGEKFRLDVKQLMFRIIDFVEKEKTGSIIPLHNAASRLESMLGISKASIFRLRSEMKQNQEHDKMPKYKNRLRRRTASETSLLTKKSHRKPGYSADIPTASSPKKKGHSGRRATALNESQQDQIR